MNALAHSSIVDGQTITSIKLVEGQRHRRNHKHTRRQTDNSVKSISNTLSTYSSTDRLESIWREESDNSKSTPPTSTRTREILVSVTFRAFRRVSTLFVHFPSALSSPRAHARTRSGYCTAVHRKEQKLPVDLTLSTSTCDSIEIISINPMVLK